MYSLSDSINYHLQQNHAKETKYIVFKPLWRLRYITVPFEAAIIRASYE